VSESLRGTWRLVDWTFCVDGDKERRPFGGNATGLLTYTQDGRMSAMLMRRDRPGTGTTTLSNASAADRARLAAGYVAYAGSYRIEGPDVVHDVELSLLPNWIGSEQRRTVAWLPTDDGGSDLELSYSSDTPAGRTAVDRLRWRRVEDVTATRETR